MSRSCLLYTSWTIDPTGMEYLLRDIYQRYGIPMIITENGLGARDVLEDGKVHDDYRIDYWTKHLQSIHRAIELGVDVRGFPVSYTHLERAEGFGADSQCDFRQCKTVRIYHL